MSSRDSWNINRDNNNNSINNNTNINNNSIE